MPAPSLKDMALRAVKKNIKEVEDLGSLPYTLCAPIIDAIVDPAHLLKLQENSPHIAEYTVAKWKEFLLRDVPSWSRNKVYPAKPELWSKVYYDEKKRATEEAEGMLRDGYASIAAKRTQQRIHYVPELILPSTKNSKVNKRIPARSAITNAVMKDVAKARLLRPPPRIKPPLRHDGVAPAYSSKVKAVSDSIIGKKVKEAKQSPIAPGRGGRTASPTEDDPLGLWGPPTTTPTKPIPPMPQKVTAQSPIRASVPQIPASPVSRLSPIESPATPTEKGPVRVLKRPPASITRGAKRTRFS
ncbi:hypothetical protein AMS68_004074 [Peltaster fructicola]|uniref:Elongin-A n=1 Tax=Peltaster fructicola TaxID=286661 RepID=A0A6H0XUX2_9PEZI|nr:hypothetical protein AMS68_004074 [Peltaster fructicola]